MKEHAPQTIVWTGKHVSVASRGGWEFVIRNTQRPAVGIVAVTADRHVVLVEQFRQPVGGRVVELPAGLAGDAIGSEREPLLKAARRELFEETGYEATRWTELARGVTSPGLTDESIVLFLAEGLSKVSSGGGDSSESITVYEVPLDSALEWLADHGGPFDLKLLAGLYAAQHQLRHRENP